MLFARSKRRLSRRAAQSIQYAIEPLEPRTMLSNIVWTNRGTVANDSDGFNSVFGNNANQARAVLDSAINSWAQVIRFFNYSGGGNTYSISINMSGTGSSYGANAGPTNFDSNGKPTAGKMTIGRGGDTTGDGLGDGADVLRRGAAAAAGDIDQAGCGELAHLRRHRLRPFVIVAEFVGQAGIGIGADQRVGNAA